jgi:hypothetical protein
MRKLLPLLIVIFSLLAGCATTENFEKKLNVYIGKSETQLVTQEGIPTSMYENEGVRYLTYSQTESGVIPGFPPQVSTTYIGGKAYTRSIGGSLPIGYTNSCSVTFTIVNKVVMSWQHKGNACRSN